MEAIMLVGLILMDYLLSFNEGYNY